MTSTLSEPVFSNLVRELGRSSDGAVLLPGDTRYDGVRGSWHLTVDPHPAIVVEVTSPADVQAAVRAARQHDVPLAVQSTGHGTYVPADGGLLVKSTAMATVTVDPERQVAFVGAGAVWSDVIAAVAPYGLAPLSGTPSVGVTGYTLGGGAGWLARQYGFAADSVLRADVVTADGELRTVSTEADPDLFWALRGGGGNFGVVTGLEIKLYPVTNVHTGMALYPIERATEMLSVYRDWTQQQPDELNTSIILMRLPPMPHLPESVHGRPVAGLHVFYAGGVDAAERALAPLRAAGGEPLVDGIQSTTFAAAADVPPHSPMAAAQRFELFQALPDVMLSRLVSSLEDLALTTVEVRHWGGAMARPDAGHGPVGHRDVPYSMNATAMLAGPGDVAGSAAVNDLVDQVRPYSTGGTFLNFLSDPSRGADAYDVDDYRNLVEVKTAWDPENIFHLNHNIAPEGGR